MSYNSILPPSVLLIFQLLKRENQRKKKEELQQIFKKSLVRTTSIRAHST